MERKPDKRIARTRHAIQAALVDLIVDRGYENVTVQHVLDRAGIGRSTFYVHFRDKEHVLRNSLDNMRAGLEHEWRSGATSASTQRLGFALPFFQHLDGHRHIWMAIVGEEAGLICDRQMRRILADLTRSDLAPIAASTVNAARLEGVVQAVVGSLMALVTWWLDCEIKMSPTEVNRLFLELTVPGLNCILTGST